LEYYSSISSGIYHKVSTLREDYRQIRQQLRGIVHFFEFFSPSLFMAVLGCFFANFAAVLTFPALNRVHAVLAGDRTVQIVPMGSFWIHAL
jgi:uncharacterized membrane protein